MRKDYFRRRRWGKKLDTLFISPIVCLKWLWHSFFSWCRYLSNLVGLQRLIWSCFIASGTKTASSKVRQSFLDLIGNYIEHAFSLIGRTGDVLQLFLFFLMEWYSNPDRWCPCRRSEHCPQKFMFNKWSQQTSVMEALMENSMYHLRLKNTVFLRLRSEIYN